MTTQPMIKLADGNIMLQLGLVVCQATHDQTVAAVSDALHIGYRAIDTAAIYKNEAGVGEALQASTLPRDQLFITTKLWNTDQFDPQKALEESLQKLRLDFFDLYLIHWPVPDQDTYVDAWRGLLRLQEQGLVKSIGVSNFHPHHLQRLKAETVVFPVINQVDLKPLFQQRQLHAWNVTHQIQTESWSPRWHKEEKGYSNSR